jgi:hypothetical protein
MVMVQHWCHDGGYKGLASNKGIGSGSGRGARENAHTAIIHDIQGFFLKRLFYG